MHLGPGFLNFAWQTCSAWTFDSFWSSAIIFLRSGLGPNWCLPSCWRRWELLFHNHLRPPSFPTWFSDASNSSAAALHISAEHQCYLAEDAQYEQLPFFHDHKCLRHPTHYSIPFHWRTLTLPPMRDLTICSLVPEAMENKNRRVSSDPCCSAPGTLGCHLISKHGLLSCGLFQEARIGIISLPLNSFMLSRKFLASWSLHKEFKGVLQQFRHHNFCQQ